MKSSPVNDDGLRECLSQEIIRKTREAPPGMVTDEITRLVLLIQVRELADGQCDCLFGGGCGHCLYAMVYGEEAYIDLAAEAVSS